MIINNNGNTVETSGVIESGSFKIEASAHAFKLLSSGLYTNKIRAVVRELLCNAADAHKLNGSNNPIDLKLPNSLDSQFYVRDYGPGLSEQDVMNLYTTYFKSTKQKSNDFTGGFGVGSKSPFAYTDMFSVTSIHNGIKSNYTAYIDDNSEPKIVKLGESEPTEEPSGLNVNFPVKKTDYDKFNEEARYVTKFFKDPVTVLGSSEKFEQRAYAKYKIGQNMYENGMTRDQLLIVMGNVSYPVDVYDDKFADSVFLKFLDKKMIIEVPVGTFSVAASREALSLDKETLAKFKEISSQWLKNIADEIEQSANSSEFNNGIANFYSHIKALSKLPKSFTPTNINEFLDLTNASPKLRSLLTPRDIVPEFNNGSIIKCSRVSLNTYSNFVSSNNTNVKYNTLDFIKESYGNKKEIAIIENGANSYGPQYDSALKLKMASRKDNYYGGTTYIEMKSQPNIKGSQIAKYHLEKDEYLKELGLEEKDVLTITTPGSPILNKGIVVSKLGSWRSGEQCEIESHEPDFLWISRSDYTKLNSNNLFTLIQNTQKNLKMKNPEAKMYIVEDKDEATVKTYKHGRSIIKDFTDELLSKRIQDRISKIQPMVQGYPGNFQNLRLKMKKYPEWENSLKDTKLGQFTQSLYKSKGGYSFDSDVRDLIKLLKNHLGNSFNSVIPARYEGKTIGEFLRKTYPFLESLVANRSTQSIDQLNHLKEYVAWRESNEITVPQNDLSI